MKSYITAASDTVTSNTKSVWGLSTAHLVTDIYSPVLPAIMPLLIAQEGYTYFLAGLIITVYNLTSSFMQPVVGWAYDTRGIAVHVSISVLMSAVFISIIGVVTDYTLVLVCAGLAALGHAFFHPSALGTVSRLTQDASRGRITSYFVVGGNLGFAIGPICAGVVVGFFGLPGLVFLAVPGIIMAVVLRTVLPPPPSRPPKVSALKTPAGGKASLRPVAVLVAASALRAWAIFASVAYLPTFLTTRGFDLVTANLLVSGMLLAGVIGQVVGGTISDRYGRKEYTLVGLVAAIPLFYLFLATDGILSLAVLMIFGFTLWSTFSVTVAMGHELMPRSVGLISGLMLGLAVGAGGMGVAATGYIADAFTLNVGLFTIPLPVIAAVLLFLAVPYPWKMLRRITRPAP
ncbi:MFS transporter [Methanoculleus frigidifontis]|uniref:MFS transporter n=1 Tax=Methanoculleus frigidifontis TaxID=2584085 RepID=UPI00265A0FE8|nr:MFS transporter [Methanoculleus sp. FWC-SCC1]